MSEQNKAIVRRFADEVWGRKNLDAIEEYHASNSVIHSPDGKLHGPAGYRRLYSIYARAFPDCELLIEEMIAEGDKVMTQYVLKGTHRGDLMGIPPTGRRVSIPGTTVMRIAGGMIVEERALWDRLALAKQLGVVTIPEGAKANAAG
jgi:steroid delta-isomerase-like uncharacterized protein